MTAPPTVSYECPEILRHLSDKYEEMICRSLQTEQIEELYSNYQLRPHDHRLHEQVDDILILATERMDDREVFNRLRALYDQRQKSYDDHKILRSKRKLRYRPSK